MADEHAPTAPAELWLGYDGLSVAFALISAVLVYAPAWDRRIAQAYGAVPGDATPLVLSTDRPGFPSRRARADLHRRWTDWQQQDGAQPPATDPNA